MNVCMIQLTIAFSLHEPLLCNLCDFLAADADLDATPFWVGYENNFELFLNMKQKVYSYWIIVDPFIIGNT